MNERIRELAEQAGAIEAKNITNIPRALSLNGEEIEKFAELIVRECVENLEANKRCGFFTGELADCDWNDVIQHQIDSLKEHFGVEE